MFVCLYGCLSQSLPCPLICSHAFVVLVWFVWLVDVVLWAFSYAWYLCAVYVKSNNNVHTKPKWYDYFNISVGGGGLAFWSSFVFRLLRLQIGERSDDLFVSSRKSYPWPVTAVRPRPAPTARSDRFFKQSAPVIRAVCFKSSSQQPVTAPTAHSDELLQQSAPGICAVCFRSPSRRPVTAVRPRPTPTARSDRLLKQSAWGIHAVCFKSSPQQPVTASRPRPALTDFWNNRREESVPFDSKVNYVSVYLLCNVAI